MKRQYTYSWNSPLIVGVAIVGFALATLSCKLDEAAARGCNLLDETAWAAFKVLSPVILACWPSAPWYVFEDSKFLEHLLQIGASVWPLICLLAG